MNVYLDASVLVALFTNDPFTGRADDALRRELPSLTVSDFAQAEFASAVSRRVRTGELTVDEAREAFSVIDVWTARAVRRIATSAADVAAAATFLRRLDLDLRTADALNIAIAERTGCAMLTFDRKMAESAKAIGLSIAAG